MLTGIPPTFFPARMKIYKISGYKEWFIFRCVNGSVIHRGNLVKKNYTFDFPNYNRVSNIKIIHLVLDLVPKSLTSIIFTDYSKIKLGTTAAFTVYSDTIIILDYCIRLMIITQFRKQN